MVKCFQEQIISDPLVENSTTPVSGAVDSRFSVPVGGNEEEVQNVQTLSINQKVSR